MSDPVSRLRAAQRVVQAGGQLERELPADGRDDLLGELLRGGDLRAGRASGAELRTLGAVLGEHVERALPAGDRRDLDSGGHREREGLQDVVGEDDRVAVAR